MTIEYVRPKGLLYPAQEAFVDSPARYTVVEAATKVGKTVACIVWLMERALAGKAGEHFWWVAPTYQTAGIAFERMKRQLTESQLPREVYRVREAEQAIEIAERMIEFKGADNPDSLYGEDVQAAVLDEASRMKAEAWHAVRSTLTHTNGPVKIIGNVRGRKNWAYQLARKAEGGAQNMAYFRLTAYDAVKGGVLKRSEVEDARAMLPSDVFEELYLAKASDDGGNPFGLDAIRNCLIQRLSDEDPSVYGIDLAKSVDWTVLVGLDADGRMCRFDRWRSDWTATKESILRTIGNVPTLVDATGVGDPIVEELQRHRLNVEGFKFSGPSKQLLMMGLRTSIQQTLIRFPEGLTSNELEAFEYEHTNTGVRYVVGSGMTDDCVMALALANKHYMDNTFHRIRWGSGGVLMASNN